MLFLLFTTIAKLLFARFPISTDRAPYKDIVYIFTISQCLLADLVMWIKVAKYVLDYIKNG